MYWRFGQALGKIWSGYPGGEDVPIDNLESIRLKQ